MPQKIPKKFLPVTGARRTIPEKRVLGMFVDKKDKVLHFGVEGKTYFIRDSQGVRKFPNMERAYKYLEKIRKKLI